MHILNFAVSFEVKHPATNSWEQQFLDQVQLSYKIAFQNFSNYQNYPVFSDFKTKHPEAKQLNKMVEVGAQPFLRAFKSFPGIYVPNNLPPLETAAFKIEILDADFFRPQQLLVSLTLISEWITLLGSTDTQLKFVRLQDQEANPLTATAIYNAQVSEAVNWHELKPNKHDQTS